MGKAIVTRTRDPQGRWVLHDAAKAGPHDPVTETPDRRPGSVRRTSTIDTRWPEGLLGPRLMDGRARDLRTGPDGRVDVLGEARVDVRASAGRLLETIETDPPRPELQQLAGVLVGPGFRAQMEQLVPDERDGLTLLHLLLDDLPGASLVSGYVHQRSDGPRPERIDDGIEREDLCAGWAREATMMTTIRVTGEHPVVLGPVAPSIERDDDPWAWHAMDPLPPVSMRRRRRIDVVAPEDGDVGAPHRIDVHFRDSHVAEDGQETIVHEYRVTGTVDAATATIVEMTARAHVLPWVECPRAVGSAGRLAGLPLRGLRPLVRETFVGTTTCTHLNDTLRGLADVEAMLGHLRSVSRS